MIKDSKIKSLLSTKVCMTPNGFVADELTPEDFAECYELFFDIILEISATDISDFEGYGEFNDECVTQYATCRDFIINTFADDEDGYWYHWREMFDTTILDFSFFEHYYKEMIKRIHYCEGQRYFVYNNAFFVNMVTDGKTMVGFPDWSRSGITDFLIDIAIMDLNKPFLRIPELFYEYCNKKNIVIDNFKERFLCMAYYKGIDVLRWHASIDDEESCRSIMKSISEIKDRMNSI